ncbi:MAG: site-2 protease family protein, partial [Pseudomonadota bacterium]
VLWLALLTAGAATIIGSWSAFRAELGGLFTASSALLFLGAWLTSKLWHELHHGIVARRYGVEVRETGILMILFLPLGAYVDVSGVWRVREAWKRLHITAAGLMGEAGLGALAILLWAEAEPGLWRAFLQALIVTTTLSAVLFNINPLMRFDGYHALVDLLGLPNLYQRGAEAASRRVLGWTCGDAAPPPRDRRGVEAYGWASLGWRMFLAVSLTALAASLAFGFGLALGAAALWGMAAMPLWRLASRGWRLGPTARRRAALRLTLAACAAAALAFAPVPERTRAPALLDYAGALSARAGAAGTVVEVLVRAGEPVRLGQPLLRLENPSLDADRRRALAQIARARMAEADAAARGDPARARDERRRAEVLGEELAEIDLRRAALVVTAPRAGIVIDENPERMLGIWTRRGAALIEVADANDLEARVWLPPEAAERLSGGADPDDGAPQFAFRPDAPGAQATPVRLTRLAPSASILAPPAAVTAEGGGPLALDLSAPEPGPGSRSGAGEQRRLASARVEARFSPRTSLGEGVGHGFGDGAAAGVRGWLEQPLRWRPLGERAAEALDSVDLSDPAGWAGALFGP